MDNLRRPVPPVRTRFACASVLLAVLIAGFPSWVAAQGSLSAGDVDRLDSFSPLLRPGEEALALPDPDGGEAGPVLTLPPPPVPTAGELGNQVRAEELVVSQIDYIGASILSREALDDVAGPFLNRPLGAEGLEALRRALTAAHVDRGYVNSGALLPPQEVAAGRLQVELVAGRIVTLRISGLSHYREDVIRRRLSRALDSPFRMGTLERELQLLDQDPRIKRIAARIVPGPVREESILEVEIEENDPRRARLGADNFESPSAGAFAGRIRVGHDNVFGWGDLFRTSVVQTEGLTRVSGQYAIPFRICSSCRSGPARFESRLILNGSYAKAELVADQFKRLEIENEAFRAAIGLEQTLWHTPSDRVDLALSFERRRTLTSQLGRGYSFVPGPENGRSEVSVFRLTGDWIHRGDASVWSARSVASFGTALLNSTKQRGGAPDGVFISWLAQLRGVYRFEESGIEVRFRGDLQLADRPLLSLEQFSVGGPGNVRGYRRNRLVRDQGLATGIDLRVPIWRSGDDRTLVSFGPFADLGYAWNRGRGGTEGIRTLSSAGLALRLQPSANFDFDLEWAQPFRNVGTSGDLQDTAILLRGVWNLDR